MIKDRPIKPTVILPDAAPLVHLAAGEALHVLNSLGRVVVVDIVAMEVTFFADKPYARDVASWLEAGQQVGSNLPVEIAETEFGPLYRLALEQDVKRPRNAGEIAIAEWLADELRHAGGPALVVYENGRVPAMLAREGVAATVAVATTRNLLALAEEEGIISDAEAVWTKIVAARPTANPASVRSYIEPSKL
jgi:hypothetical protein